MIDGELCEIVSDRPGARGYGVERAGSQGAAENALPTRLLQG
jgi:hypothetical protein